MISLDAGDHPFAIALGDLDGDLDLNIVTGNLGTHNVGVMLNLGSTTFGPQVFYETGSNIDSVMVEDFNNDGNLDIVQIGSTNTIRVLSNNGDGTFAPMVSYGVGPGPSGIAIGDLNGDGWLDVAVTNYQTDNMSVLINRGPRVCDADFTGDGELDFFDMSAFFGAFAAGVFSADLTGDGVLDFFDVSAFLGAYATGCP